MSANSKGRLPNRYCSKLHASDVSTWLELGTLPALGANPDRRDPTRYLYTRHGMLPACSATPSMADAMVYANPSGRTNCVSTADF